MKLVFMAVFGLLLALPAGAQAPAGWVTLFDGKDLEGWVNNGQENGSLKMARSWVRAPWDTTAT